MPKKKKRNDASREAVRERIKVLLDNEESWRNETDRAAAIIAGAYLDDMLCVLLQRFLVDDPKIVHKILGLDGEGPLCSFSARIDIAFCLALIGPHDAPH